MRRQQDPGKAIAIAKRLPEDVRAQMEAAYACDRAGNEREAIAYYERAWALGVPEGDRQDFVVGFGSTLRNVGRADEAVVHLGEAVAAHPENAALRAFLALALFSAGHPRLAMATMLETALSASRTGAFRGYEPALASYQAELIDAALGVASPENRDD
jgi:tetratricopeptide (TPR) repeat protein